LRSLAQVVELADTPDSKSGPLGGAGSIPALGTLRDALSDDTGARRRTRTGAMFSIVRARLVFLAISGSALAAIIVMRRRAMAKNAESFHQRYG
jgi:hypothetical protein